MNTNGLYPEATRAIFEKRVALAPEIMEAFRNFSKAVFKDGALPEKTKQLIAVAVAHVTQCPLLHSRPYRTGNEKRRQQGGNHGSHLGRF